MKTSDSTWRIVLLLEAPPVAIILVFGPEIESLRFLKIHSSSPSEEFRDTHNQLKMPLQLTYNKAKVLGMRPTSHKLTLYNSSDLHLFRTVSRDTFVSFVEPVVADELRQYLLNVVVQREVAEVSSRRIIQ